MDKNSKVKYGEQFAKMSADTIAALEDLAAEQKAGQTEELIKSNEGGEERRGRIKAVDEFLDDVTMCIEAWEKSNEE